MYVSPPRFTEENDARPTHVIAGLAIALLVIDHLVQLTAGPHSRTLYMAAVLVAMTAWITGMYCLAGCIWHPIPKELRTTGGVISLTPPGPEATPASMFTSFDELTAIPDDSVDSSQTEVRARIQWMKMFLILGSLALTFFLLVHWSH
jgi:hypothetical protein